MLCRICIFRNCEKNRSVNAQISLRIRGYQQNRISVFVVRLQKYSVLKRLLTKIDNSDQIALVRRLIRAFAVPTYMCMHYFYFILFFHFFFFFFFFL